ncbi:tRNA (guanosine(37)-N1)-methyltransferase TrmD [Clostridium frigidicarnis]|uniref:tRNA (guanine-N(1)-)-methyltransferase n=1 Tax=Clostridium frigidicarnis TaxID=84698 RepID=A0A1I0ZNT2_9CLOT|nr:tRNA (guanosine(37)-N1)-methyltransferase TrmD [Clostridium frigidicarnis]SFB27364.1 tRNA (Guanine37-N(1)-) methyltransferase [Clostridium frigidicarnis]
MKISILTLFPEMFDIFGHSIMGRAKENNTVFIDTYNIRDFSLNKHKKVDDYPYGGGAGMVMTPQPIVDCIREVKKHNKGKVVFLGPRGKTFNHSMAKQLSNEEEIIFLCGHYEGIDERVYEHVDLEISLGDFILTGGEMACIPIVDSICRLIPGVLGKEESFQEESYYNGLLEYPQYTRPEVFEGAEVPRVLCSGHHENIRKWRRIKSLQITKEKRPDLYRKVELTKEDKKLLQNK